MHSLAYLKRGHHLEDFAAKIRVNAIKINGKWWEIHDMPRAHIDLTEIPHLQGAQEIKPFDFATLFDQEELYSKGMDGSTLFFYPQIGKLVIEEDSELAIDKDFRFVCVHKRTDKIGKNQCISIFQLIADFQILGPKCPGDTAECHDRGFCYNGVCFCTDGYAGESCESERRLA